MTSPDEEGRPGQGSGPSILTTDSTATLDYLRSVYGDNPVGELRISAFALLDGTKNVITQGFSTLEAAAEFAIELDGRSTHQGVYCTGSTVMPGLPAWKRGESEHAKTLYYMGIDLDVWNGTSAHKAPNLPRSLADCKDLVEALSFPPVTRWISSGHGYYPQWQYPEPIAVDDWWTLQAKYNDVKAYVEKVALDQFGWKVDPTFDLARVWRLPGTTNRKVAGDHRPCYVMEGI